MTNPKSQLICSNITAAIWLVAIFALLTIHDAQNLSYYASWQNQTVLALHCIVTLTIILITEYNVLTIYPNNFSLRHGILHPVWEVIKPESIRKMYICSEWIYKLKTRLMKESKAGDEYSWEVFPVRYFIRSPKVLVIECERKGYLVQCRNASNIAGLIRKTYSLDIKIQTCKTEQNYEQIT